MKFRKICFRETCLERSLTEREKKICIDQNGIEEENFEKRRICIGKTEWNYLKLKHLECVKFIMDFWNDIIQNGSKTKKFNGPYSSE